MRFPLIKIREKDNDKEGYFVGADENHHRLIDRNGDLEFLHIQNGYGTGRHGEYEYEFITTKGFWGYEIEMGSIWDVLNIYKDDLNIKEGNLNEEFNSALESLKTVFDKATAIKNKEFDKFVEESFKSQKKIIY